MTKSPHSGLQLMRRWRTLAGGRAVQFGPAELNQLHLVEVALRLEAPEIGMGSFK